MKRLLATVLLLGGILPWVEASPRPKPRRPEGCVRGGIAYAAASYVGDIDVKKKYARRFDRLTKRLIQQLLCSSELQGLPVQEPDSTDGSSDRFIEQSYLEPLFINLATLDGLYGVRHYGRINAKLRCGYFHEIVLIASKHFYALGKDTVTNKQVIIRLLSSSFLPAETERMQREYNRNHYCQDFTFLPPEIIRRKEKLLFDLHAPR